MLGGFLTRLHVHSAGEELARLSAGEELARLGASLASSTMPADLRDACLVAQQQVVQALETRAPIPDSSPAHADAAVALRSMQKQQAAGEACGSGESPAAKRSRVSN